MDPRSTAVWQRIRTLRNGLEHADEKFVEGTTDVVQLAVSSDAIHFAGVTVYFSELASLLEELDSFVHCIFFGFKELHDEEDREYRRWVDESSGDNGSHES